MPRLAERDMLPHCETSHAETSYDTTVSFDRHPAPSRVTGPALLRALVRPATLGILPACTGLRRAPEETSIVLERSKGEGPAVEGDFDVGTRAGAEIVDAHRHALQRVVIQPVLHPEAGVIWSPCDAGIALRLRRTCILCPRKIHACNVYARTHTHTHTHTQPHDLGGPVVTHAYRYANANAYACTALQLWRSRGDARFRHIEARVLGPYMHCCRGCTCI